MTLYHGSNQEFSEVLLSKSKDNRDFGKGFYMTTYKTQAQDWAIALCKRYGGGTFVYEFDFTITDDMKVKVFSGLTLDWLTFVTDNRRKGRVQHDFDLVQGPVANDTTARTIAFYVDGVYTAEMALEKLRYMTPNDQVSIHTEKALSHLTMVRRSADAG